MQKKLSMSLAAIAVTASLSVNAHEDDFSSLSRDVDPGYAGPEAIVPFIKETPDSNGDGIPEKLAVSFKVFQGGTNTLIRQTTAKGLYYPAIPCTSPAANSLRTDFKGRFQGRPGSQRGHVAYQLQVSCWDTSDNTEKEAYKTYVYSADLYTGASVWLLGLGQELQSFHGMDTNGDGVNDTLVLMTWVNQDMDVRVLNPATGAIISYNRYAIWR